MDHFKRRSTITITRYCQLCQKNYDYVQGRVRAQACVPCYTQYRSLYNLLANAKYRAGQRDLDFDLDIDWAREQGNKCPRTGIDLTFEHNGKDYSKRLPTAASIDKIDPSRGYTKDNCELVCWWYNVSKQQFTDDQVRKLCQAVVDTYTTNSAPSVQSVEKTVGETT